MCTVVYWKLPFKFPPIKKCLIILNFNFRQILESHHIRKNLTLWIDLTFGFKQVTDFVKKQESSGNNHVKTSCRMKNPLFTSPHPLPFHKNKKEDCYCCNIPSISGISIRSFLNLYGSIQNCLILEKLWFYLALKILKWRNLVIPQFNFIQSSIKFIWKSINLLTENQQNFLNWFYCRSS